MICDFFFFKLSLILWLHSYHSSFSVVRPPRVTVVGEFHDHAVYREH